MSVSPDYESFKDLSGYEYTSLEKVIFKNNLTPRNGCIHYYHRDTDTIYCWCCATKPPQWIINNDLRVAIVNRKS